MNSNENFVTTSWISVDERTPEDNENVIVYISGRNGWQPYQSTATYMCGEFRGMVNETLSPSHWMPLPVDPEGE